MARHIGAVGLIKGKADGTQLPDRRDLQHTFWCGSSFSGCLDPVRKTGTRLDEGSLWVWDGIDITDMIADPFGRNGIAGKRGTEANHPGGLVLGDVVALGPIEDKADGTQ